MPTERLDALTRRVTALQDPAVRREWHSLLQDLALGRCESPARTSDDAVSAWMANQPFAWGKTPTNGYARTLLAAGVAPEDLLSSASGATLLGVLTPDTAALTVIDCVFEDAATDHPTMPLREALAWLLVNPTAVVPSEGWLVEGLSGEHAWRAAAAGLSVEEVRSVNPDDSAYQEQVSLLIALRGSVLPVG